MNVFIANLNAFPSEKFAIKRKRCISRGACSVLNIVRQDFVTGANPTDANDFLYIMITVSNGVPYVSW